MKSVFKKGTKIVITDLLKMQLVDGSPINLPVGTKGRIEEVGDDYMTFSCHPVTTAIPKLSFSIGFDEPQMACVVPASERSLPDPVPCYDDYMPGYLLNASEYLVDGDDGEYLLFLRKRWTPWRVEVHFYPGSDPHSSLVGVFRTTGEGIEQFTLLPKVEDYTLVQVQLFKNKSKVFCYLPAEVDIDHKKHLVTIHLLCNFRFEDGRLVMTMLE